MWSIISGVPDLRAPRAKRVLECSQCGAYFSQRFLLLTCELILVWSTRILDMLFSCPRRVEILGSTALLPLLGWGVHRQGLKHTARLLFNSNSISLVRKALLHTSCSLRAYLWCWYSSVVFTISSSCSSALCAGHALFVSSYGWSPRVVLVPYGYGTWYGTVWDGVRCGTVCDMMCWYGMMARFGGYTIWNNLGRRCGMLVVWYDVQCGGYTMWLPIAWWYGMFQHIRSVRVEYILWISSVTN